VETELQVIIRELNDEMVRLGKIGPDAAGVGVMGCSCWTMSRRR
jgi:hypothetical protein